MTLENTDSISPRRDFLGGVLLVRREFLVKPYPASSLVGVTELAVPGLDFEVEATAVI